MTSSDHIIEANDSDFADLVLKKSEELPVLVDFWAAWCAPCRILMPILASLAQRYDGKFVLAKVNTDANPRLAIEYGIRNLPTVSLFHHREVVGEVHGLQPENVMRELLESHIERASDRLRVEAARARQGGDVRGARDLLEEALDSDPENYRVHADLAGLLIETGDYDEAETVLKQLSPNKQQDEHILAMLVRIRFHRMADTAPEESDLEAALAADSENSQARYQLSAYKVLGGSYEEALSHLLKIVERDRTFGNDAARKGILDIFTLLDNGDPLVKRYRTLLSRVIN